METMTAQTDSAQAGSAVDAFGRLLVEAEIGKNLGLAADDLAVGLDIAKSLLERGQPVRAMRIYCALVLCFPTVADYQIGLANCALQLEEHYMALQAASAVIALEPRNPRGYFLSGRACLAAGELAEAREDLADALRLAKESGDTLVATEAERLLKTAEAKPS